MKTAAPLAEESERVSQRELNHAAAFARRDLSEVLYRQPAVLLRADDRDYGGRDAADGKSRIGTAVGAIP